MVLKDLGHGISMKTAQSVFDEYGPTMDVLENWKDLKDPSSLQKVSRRQTSRCLGGGMISPYYSWVSLTWNHVYSANIAFVAEKMYFCSQGLCIVGACQAGKPESYSIDLVTPDLFSTGQEIQRIELHETSHSTT